VVKIFDGWGQVPLTDRMVVMAGLPPWIRRAYVVHVETMCIVQYELCEPSTKDIRH